jgi:microsomal dipeptidase-like Zn-dependent dipeptidase
MKVTAASGRHVLLTTCLGLVAWRIGAGVADRVTPALAQEHRPLARPPARGAPPAELHGWVDLHTHPMSHLGFGRKAMHGAPDVDMIVPAGTRGCNPDELRARSMSDALGSCHSTHGGWGLDNPCGDHIRAAIINFGIDDRFLHRLPIVPSAGGCPAGWEKGDADALCYPECRPGFHGAGPMCHKNCPPGFADTGLHCTKPPAYGRGAGYLLQNVDQRDCERDHTQGCEKSGAIWYPRCRPGFHGLGPMCHKNCPSGFADTGLHCTKPPAYGRGTGYLLDNERARCERDHPQGCEQCGAPFYPRCRRGFHAFGCNVCTPNCPAGMTDIGVSCQKNGSYGRGVGYAGHTDDRGACERDHPGGCEQCGAPLYPKCRAGFHPVGCNVCSPNCPAGMTDIGVSCQKNGSYGRGVGRPITANLHGDHRHAGAPRFRYWPHHTSILHQQMWWEWLERARDGGLRVIVALTVNSVTLAEILNGDPPYDDRTVADVQIAETIRFARRHPDFMEIAYTPADLRRIVAAGKLAVVLGMEIDKIGNFGRPGVRTDEQAVRAEIRRLHRNGVRYIFPIHLIDNAFGGAAVYDMLFNFANRHQNGYLFRVVTDRTIGYSANLTDGPLGGENAAILGLHGLLRGVGELPAPCFNDLIKCSPPPGKVRCCGSYDRIVNMLAPSPALDAYKLIPPGHVNRLGLTPLGEVAIDEMLRLGIIIDIDHMSESAARRTVALAAGTPLVLGHNGVRPTNGNERGAPADLIERVLSSGGMLGLGTAKTIPAKLVSQHLQVAGLRLDGGGKPPPGSIALGTDVNGLEPLPGNGRRGRSSEAASRTFYAGFLARSGITSRCAKPGGGSWDYITGGGVAHYGLMPEFLFDLKENTAGGQDLHDGLMRSAEHFARMWEAIEARARR